MAVSKKYIDLAPFRHFHDLVKLNEDSEKKNNIELMRLQWGLSNIIKMFLKALISVDLAY